MTNYSEINKAMKIEENAERLGYFGMLDTTILLDIVNGKINPVDLAKWHLANRGLDKTGKWVGFSKADQIWSGK